MGLHLENQPAALIDLRLFKSVVLCAVRSLYGDVGLPGEVDVLQLLADRTALLRVAYSKQQRLWSALTLVTDFDGQPCSMQVLRTSPFLLALACDSRDAMHIQPALRTAEGLQDPWAEFFSDH